MTPDVLAHVNELATYHQDWDGDNAHAILPETIYNVHTLLAVATPAFLSAVRVQDMFPTHSGTVTIELGVHKRYFVLDVGQTHALCYYRVSSGLYGNDEGVPLTLGAISDFMQLYAEYCAEPE